MASGNQLGRRAMHTGIALFYGNMLSFLLGIAVLVAIARLLGPSQFGAYTIAVSYYLLVDAAFQYGIGSYMSKHLAQYSAGSPNKELLVSSLRSGLSLALIFAAATTALGIGAAFFAAKIYANAGITFATLAIASSIIFFAILYNVSVSGLTGLGKSKLIAEAMSFQALAELVGAVSLVLLGFGVNGALAGISLGYAFGFAIAISLLLSEFRKIAGATALHSRSTLREALHFIAPLGAINVMGSATGNFSTLLLGVFVPAAVIGSFGIATRSVAGLTSIYVSITAMLLPVFSISIAASRAHGKAALDKGAYNNLLAYSLSFVLPMFVFVAVLSRPLVFLFVSDKYAYAPLYLSLIAIGISISLLGRFISSLFIATGMNKDLMLLYALAAVVQLALLLALVPILKAIGAIVAVFFFGSAAFTYLMARASKRRLGAQADIPRILRIFAAGALLGIALLASYALHSAVKELLLGIAIALIIYPALLGALKALSKSDIRKISNAVEGLPARKLFELFLRYANCFAS
ncbi:MAG: oligosaccharide flippase family protein [Candidatus Micrarchaeaceae archaeon]